MTKKLTGPFSRKQDFIDLQKIKLGFVDSESPIANAEESFLRSIKNDRNFNNPDNYWAIDDFFTIRPQSEIRTKCCNKELYFHRGVTRGFLWSFFAYPEVIGTSDFFSEFKKMQRYLEILPDYPEFSCGCKKFKKALLTNNKNDFYKYFPIQELRFTEERDRHTPFDYYGLAEFQRVFGESEVLVDDGRCIYTFSQGKLNGPYLRYLVVELIWEDEDEFLIESIDEFNQEHSKKTFPKEDLGHALFDTLDSDTSVQLLCEFLEVYINQSHFVIRFLDECHDLYGKFFDQYIKNHFKECIKSIKKGDNLSEFLPEYMYLTVGNGVFKDNLKHGTFETLNNTKNEELLLSLLSHAPKKKIQENLITTTVWENGKLVK